MPRSGERTTPFGRIALFGDELSRPEHDLIQRLGKIARPGSCVTAASGRPTDSDDRPTENDWPSC
jgi:hypothetical protein